MWAGSRRQQRLAVRGGLGEGIPELAFLTLPSDPPCRPGQGLRPGAYRPLPSATLAPRL